MGMSVAIRSCPRLTPTHTTAAFAAQQVRELRSSPYPDPLLPWLAHHSTDERAMPVWREFHDCHATAAGAMVGQGLSPVAGAMVGQGLSPVAGAMVGQGHLAGAMGRACRGAGSRAGGPTGRRLCQGVSVGSQSMVLCPQVTAICPDSTGREGPFPRAGRGRVQQAGGGACLEGGMPLASSREAAPVAGRQAVVASQGGGTSHEV